MMSSYNRIHTAKGSLLPLVLPRLFLCVEKVFTGQCHAETNLDYVVIYQHEYACVVYQQMNISGLRHIGTIEYI
jgi:hypothetical protein